MDGMGWIIKNALAAAGVELDPDEIIHTIETAKVLIPRIAYEFENMRDSIARIELKLDMLITAQHQQRLSIAATQVTEGLQVKEA